MAEGLSNDFRESIKRNKERVALIWFQSSSIIDTEFKQAKDQIQAIHNWIFDYDNIERIVTDLQQIDFRAKFFLITSKADASELLLNIRQLDSIFLFSNDATQDQLFLDRFNKIVNVFSRCNDLVTSVKENIMDVEEHIKIFSFYDQHQRATQDISIEHAKFLWLQLFKDVILHLPKDDEEAKEEMINVCRQYYQKNRQFLKQIDDFQEHYHQGACIYWYTIDGFIYRLINTALRTENIEQLYTFRYYIAELSRQLRDEYQKVKHGNESMIQLYRGTIITRNEVEQLQANVGQLIATNTYWSTSRKKSVAYMYITGCQNDTDRMVVLFQIECNLRNEDNSVIFADIIGSSNFPQEKEVLFDIGAVFRIESVVSDTIDKTEVVVVQMKTTNEGKDVLEEYQNQNREEMVVESPTIMLCTILKRMGKLDQSYQLLERLRLHPNKENRVHIYNRLGITYKDERRYDLALEHFEQALQLIDSSDPSQRKYAAFIHHNKGLLYAKRKQHDEALEFYGEAIAMLTKEISPPNTGIAQFLSSIGRIYFHQRKYQEALQYQQDALQMREECLPADHLVLAFSYADIGNIYRRQRDYEQALHYHKKALALRQRYLLANHYQTTYSLRDVGKTYFEMDSIPSLLEDIDKTFDVDASKDASADSLRDRLEALELQWQIEPVDYSRLIYRLDQLVATYEQLNNVDDSLKYAKQALEIQRSIQPYNYLAVSQRLDHLGFMCKLMRNLNDALMYYEEALDIRAKHLSKNSWYMGCSWKNLATVYERMRDQRRALDFYNRARTEYHVNYQHKHSFCQEMSRNIARVKRYL
ncbi:unnamed protein product [Adineta steineri]|uniref:NAD(P)(+)--arginine ADP-ribosyltransferase n=1 Tax=Adineta steineri TaxID=433720 RepID=A0A815H2D1_9BILA|nr:unnamed protein product [Adineta steineri]